jgi:hypothetical protein
VLVMNATWITGYGLMFTPSGPAWLRELKVNTIRNAKMARGSVVVEFPRCVIGVVSVTLIRMSEM